MSQKLSLSQMALACVARMRMQGTDDGFCEAKSCAHGLGKSVWESVSAFANTAGGLLLLGIDEEAGFTVAEGFDASAVIAQFAEGMGDGSVQGVRLTNPPAYQLERVEVEGRQVVAVLIEENDPHSKPCYITARGLPTGALRRIDDRDVRLSPTEVFELLNMLNPNTAEREEIAGSSIDDLKGEYVEHLIQARKGCGAFEEADPVETKLRRLGVISASGQLTLCGLIALGRYPQQHLPLCSVDVIAWPGTVDDHESRVRYEDRAICEGPIPDMLSTALAAIKRNLRKCAILQGDVRVDILEVPEEAIREAIANALIHREYASYFQGTPVTVGVFYDRIEVTSPGGLWGGKTLDNLADGVSRSRNANLMQLMRDVRYTDVQGASAEGMGRGISLMQRRMQERGLLAPSFKVTPDEFTVRLYRPETWPPIVDKSGAISCAQSNGRRKLPQARLAQGAIPDSACALSPDAGLGDGRLPFSTDGDGFAPAGSGSGAGERGASFHEAGYNPAAAWRVNLESFTPVEHPVKEEEKPLADADKEAHFFLQMKDGWVLEILREQYPEPLTIHEISQRGSKSLPITRRAVRELLDAGQVIATAPPTSKNRKYLVVA